MNPGKINDGGPAFGHSAENGHCCGATLRDYFAAQALTNLSGEGGIVDMVRTSYAIADAMLAERIKEKP